MIQAWSVLYKGEAYRPPQLPQLQPDGLHMTPGTNARLGNTFAQTFLSLSFFACKTETDHTPDWPQSNRNSDLDRLCGYRKQGAGRCFNTLPRESHNRYVVLLPKLLCSINNGGGRLG